MAGCAAVGGAKEEEEEEEEGGSGAGKIINELRPGISERILKLMKRAEMRASLGRIEQHLS